MIAGFEVGCSDVGANHVNLNSLADSGACPAARGSCLVYLCLIDLVNIIISVLKLEGRGQTWEGPGVVIPLPGKDILWR